MTQLMRIPKTSLEPDTEATTSEWGCPAALSRVDREVLGMSLPSRSQPRIFLLVALALVVPHHQFFLPKSLAADDPILTNEHTSLTPQAAESLSARNRSLHLNGLSTLPAPVARVLASHTGFLYLNGLTGLDSATADILAGHTGPLRLNAVTTIDAPTAAALARHTGDLELLGLRSLSDEAALRIAKYNGVLRLNPAVECSTNAKDYMAQQKILSDAASRRNRQRWLDIMARLEVARRERQRAGAANIAINPSSGTVENPHQNTSRSTNSEFAGLLFGSTYQEVRTAYNNQTLNQDDVDNMLSDGIEYVCHMQGNPRFKGVERTVLGFNGDSLYRIEIRFNGIESGLATALMEMLGKKYGVPEIQMDKIRPLGSSTTLEVPHAYFGKGGDVVAEVCIAGTFTIVRAEDVRLSEDLMNKKRAQREKDEAAKVETARRGLGAGF